MISLFFLKKNNINIPLLIQYGKDDKTCSKEGFELLFNKNKNSDKTIKEYNGRHCITHDICILDLLEDLTSWILDRSKK